MPVALTITEGPHAGQSFTFDRHDTFLVGRTPDCHFRLSFDDPYFSRRHFLIEINPPRCRVMDLRSRNGIHVNGEKVEAADLKDGDEVRAGHTVFKVSVQWPRDPNEPSTLTEPQADQSQATIAYEPIPSVSIPGYRIEQELGRGFMGIVYKAQRESSETTVALKVIAPAPGVPEKQIARFLREAEILGQLRHPNIVGYVDGGQVNGLVFLAMEYLTGPDMARVLADKGPMKPSTAVRIICQVLTGLQHAHEKGYVHRDIKPANIILNTENSKRVAKLADFGLARVFESSRLSGLTMQGETGGTPAFMAPEQVTHYRDVTPAADQYSVAATLYSFLANAYPYDMPKNVWQGLVKVVTQEPVPIRDRRPDIAEKLAAVIHKALNREPNERYSSADEFRRALLEFK